MKFILLLLIAIGASASSGPRIVIHPGNLIENDVAPIGSTGIQETRFNDHYKKHTSGLATTHSQGKVFSCVYNENSECRVPYVEAFDQHDNSISVIPRYFVQSCSNECDLECAAMKEEHKKTWENRNEKYPEGIKHNCDKDEVIIDDDEDPESYVKFTKDFVHKTQLLKYTSFDYVGNAAPEVTIAFYVWDKTPPAMIICQEVLDEVSQKYHHEYFEATHIKYMDNPPNGLEDWKRPISKYPRPFKGCIGNSWTTAQDEVDGEINVDPKDLKIEYSQYISDPERNDMVTRQSEEVSWETVDSVSFNVIGTYYLTYWAFDKSGNKGEVSKYITIDDNEAPVLEVLKRADETLSITHECGAPGGKYQDQGAVCRDRRDADIEAKLTGEVDENTQGVYHIKYNCTDQEGNKAEQQVRTITVIDTTAPNTFHLQGDAQVQFYAGEAEWMPFEDNTKHGDRDLDNTEKDRVKKAVRCGVHENENDSDKCNSRESMGDLYHDLTEPQKKGHLDQWAICRDECVGTVIENSFSPAWNHMVPGKYIETYTCRDTADLLGEKYNRADDITREITLLDKHQPILMLNHDERGGSPLRIPAANGEVYKDAGAVCTDEIEKDISHKVQVSGDVAINLAVPGTYHIRYDCADDSGNQGDQITREIVVYDDVVPTIKLNGDAIIGIEGSFAWTDPGATAWDALDGVITSNIVVEGDAVDPFGVAHTGDTIGKDQGVNDGVYRITYDVKDKAGNEAQQKIRTVVIKDTLPPIITLTRKGQDITNYRFGHGSNPNFPPSQGDTSNFKPVNYNTLPYNIANDQAQTRTYRPRIVGSHKSLDSDDANFNGARSNEGNVIKKVWDEATQSLITLPEGQRPYEIPVTKTLFEDDPTHPRYKERIYGGYVNLNEQASHRINGWVVGAIASAITGIALIGMSMRKKKDIHAAIPV